MRLLTNSNDNVDVDVRPDEIESDVWAERGTYTNLYLNK